MRPAHEKASAGQSLMPTPPPPPIGPEPSSSNTVGKAFSAPADDVKAKLRAYQEFLKKEIESHKEVITTGSAASPKPMDIPKPRPYKFAFSRQDINQQASPPAHTGSVSQASPLGISVSWLGPRTPPGSNMPWLHSGTVEGHKDSTTCPENPI